MGKQCILRYVMEENYRYVYIYISNAAKLRMQKEVDDA